MIANIVLVVTFLIAGRRKESMKSDKLNKEIRLAIAISGVRFYEVANELGISQCHLSHKLQKELSEDEKNKILGIIDSLKE